MYLVTSQNMQLLHVTRKMAIVNVFLFILLLVFRELYGELSSELRKELLSRVISRQTGEKEIRIDNVVFKHLRLLNDSILLADYEIDSNDVTLEFPRTGTVREKLPTRNFKGIKVIDYKNNENAFVGQVSGLRLMTKKESASNMVDDYELIKNKNNKESRIQEPTGNKYAKMNSIKRRTSEIKQNIKELTLQKQFSGNRPNAKKSSSSLLDKMVDLLLNFVRFELHETGRDEIVLPDVDESFTTYVLNIPIKGEFKSENGWFKNLSTVYRTGEVVTTMTMKKITLECDLGLRVMKFGYQKYHAELLGIGVSGSLTGSIAADSIATKISLAYVNGTCTAHLDSLKVARLSGIDVTLSGWDGFGWLLSFIANCVSGSYRDKIISAVEHMLSQTVEEKLKYFNCKHLFPLVS